MRILALDLGTKTGYALEADSYPLSCGSTVLATPKEIKYQAKLRMDRRGDMRFLRLIRFLRSLLRCFEVDWIVFEDVQFASTSQQAHLWATWRAAVWLVADEFQAQVECCPVGTLKKFATGSGRAEKSDMARYLCQNPRFRVGQANGLGVYDTVTGLKLDDNAVDALHLLNWMKHTLRK